MLLRLSGIFQAPNGIDRDKYSIPKQILLGSWKFEFKALPDQALQDQTLGSMAVSSFWIQ